MYSRCDLTLLISSLNFNRDGADNLSQNNFSENENISSLVDDYYIDTGEHLISKDMVLSVLKPGHAFKVYIKSSKTWDINVVLNISEQNILIPFKDKYIAETLMINDVIKCSFAVEKHSVNLMCVIKSIFLTSLPTVLLKVLKIEIRRNVRSSPRYEVNYIGKVNYNFSDEKICYISDISISGASITTKEQMIKGNSLKLSVIDNEFPMVVCRVANVRDKRQHDDKIVYGLKFDNMTPDDEEKIRAIIKHIETSEYESISSICKAYGIL